MRMLQLLKRLSGILALTLLAGEVGTARAWPLAPNGRAISGLVRKVVADASSVSTLLRLDPGREPRLLVIPEGPFAPFYTEADGTKRTVTVPAFAIAAAPVTRAEFARFVALEPRWRRSKAQRLFAEAGYLASWSGDLRPGEDAAGSATEVSWFAAKAYCESRGQRLPTTTEWERAASWLGPRFSSEAAGAGAPLTRSLREWTADFNAVPLASGSSADVGALFCGAGARATDASDYASFLRYSFRSSLRADYTLKNLGFRCAAGAS